MYHKALIFNHSILFHCKLCAIPVSDLNTISLILINYLRVLFFSVWHLKFVHPVEFVYATIKIFLFRENCIRMMPKWAWLLALVGVANSSPQSNYNLQNLNVEFEEGQGLPALGILNGTVTELGEFLKNN